MAEEKEPTRRELAEALAKANALIEEQGKALAELRSAPVPEAWQAEMVKTLKDLRELSEGRTSRLSPAVAPTYAGPAPTLVSYKGLVISTEPCWYDYRRDAGEVFEVDVPALWTDDPYQPVRLVRTDDNGNPVTEPNPDAPQRIDFRFRRVVSASVDPTPKRASEY